MTIRVDLDQAGLEQLADLVAARVLARLETNTGDDSLLSAAEIARRYGVTRSWCYEHADELGAIRIGNGSRPRLRFNPQTVERRLEQRSSGPQPALITKPRRHKREIAGHTASGAPLLQINDAA